MFSYTTYNLLFLLGHLLSTCFTERNIVVSECLALSVLYKAENVANIDNLAKITKSTTRIKFNKQAPNPLICQRRQNLNGSKAIKKRSESPSFP